MTLRLAVERHRQLCVRDVETPILCRQAPSGKRDQGGRDCVQGRDLIAGSNSLHECFNNVDVGVPSWLTEPRDKFSYREFASSSPLYVFAFYIATCELLLS